MTDRAPKIEFPSANYPIKVIGEAHDQFQQDALAVLDRLNVTLSSDRIQQSASSKGRYVSVTLFIRADSEQQLRNINTNLRALPAVKTVL